MTYVVTAACVNCKFTDCVDVCPVSCFYEGENTLAINPDECIDCAACETECPVTAIFADGDVPDDQQHWTEINAVVTGTKEIDDADTEGWPESVVSAAKAGVDSWPNIDAKKDQMDTAEDNRDKDGKDGDLSIKGFAG